MAPRSSLPLTGVSAAEHKGGPAEGEPSATERRLERPGGQAQAPIPHSELAAAERTRSGQALHPTGRRCQGPRRPLRPCQKTVSSLDYWRNHFHPFFLASTASITVFLSSLCFSFVSPSIVSYLFLMFLVLVYKSGKQGEASLHAQPPDSLPSPSSQDKASSTSSGGSP